MYDRYGSAKYSVSTIKPGDKGGRQLWTMSDRVKSIDEESIFYDIDTNSGQSGSPIWFKQFSKPFVIGIHTLGEQISYQGNSGVRLSKQKLEMIISIWLSQTIKSEAPKFNSFGDLFVKCLVLQKPKDLAYSKEVSFSLDGKSAHLRHWRRLDGWYRLKGDKLVRYFS